MEAGKILIIAGLTLVVAGIFIHFAGKLPGDIYIKRDNFSFYFPITTSILISVVLSVLFYLFSRFFR